MILSDVINIVGITAYSLLMIFFLWVRQVSGTFSRSHYWLVAVIFVLMGRINLYFFPAFLSPESIQSLYAIFLTLEKLFIILGLLYFFNDDIPTKHTTQLILFSLAVLLGVTFLANVVDDNFYFQTFFSTTQAIFLFLEAYILWQYRHNLFIRNRVTIIVMVFAYGVHWLTFPIATHYPLWLSFGYLLGNGLNLIIYLSFAYLVIFRFQNRLQNAEKSALNLAEKAKQASTAKSEFLANMSHEIRTPMNGVISMLELLKHEQLTQEQHERVAIALKSGQSLLDIINDILDFSKIEAGKLKIEQYDFDIVALLSDITNVMKNLATAKGIELILDTSAVDYYMVKSDPVRVKQIILNLIGNAIKFTEKGKIVLQAAVTKAETKVTFSCSVIDTGVGIEQDKLNEIFNSFNQADTSTTRNYGGTGLGLSISKRLCELMHGQITVSSELGKGSTFSISLPVESSDKEPIAFTPSKISSLNVLVVDDSEPDLEVMQNLLEYWKVSVVTASSSNDALALCQGPHHFDIAFINIHMPVMDGERLAKSLKSLSGCSHIKFVLLTPISNKVWEDRALNGPFERVVVKPVVFSTLFNLLQELAVHIDNKAPQVERTTVEDDESLPLPNWSARTKIMVVDDNKINQIVAKKVLAHFHLKSEVADNGAEAIAKIKVANAANRPFTFILMDCQMPIMDGYETTKNIRKGDCGEQRKQLPIVAMTANAMSGDREKCIEAGMNDYLAKPLEKDKLLEVLKEWLSIGSE